MNARVLIVEDEREIAELIELYFREEGADVTLAATGEQAIALAHQTRFDLVLLDINLPGTDGFEVLASIRKRDDVPVIIISAREADEDQIYALGIGADEYVTKPFSPKVLVARGRALLRRHAATPTTSGTLHFGPYTFDTDSYLLLRAGARVSLSAKEFDVLAALIDAGGAPLKSEEIYERVWENQYGDVATVGVYIQRLRRKLEDSPQDPEYIETIHGKGYRFRTELLTGEESR
ncbi:MAG: response regulator transcription factor [Spirochaetales bacterium]